LKIVKAIVIDDAPDIRIYVRALLEKWGYQAEDASEGLEGFARIKGADIRIVVCDWMMPGMSGLDLCRAVREAELGHYVYIILLTGRSDKADLLEGLRAGADDFLSKPFDARVLQARLRVGERILELEQRLAEQNRELRDSRNRLEHAYGQIQADLTAAARIQVQMLPTSDRILLPFRAEWLFLPASQVSGDSFNFFDLTPNVIGFYHLDVSGHGIPAALLSASLSRSLTPGGGPGVAARADFLAPANLLTDLNRQLGDPDGEIENFATMVYGTLDRRTRQVAIALAGHPLPIILHANGKIEYLKPGGLPVGMFPDAAYDSQTFHLDPGDRLILYSDGVTECQNPQGRLFGDEQMEAATAAATASSSKSLCSVLAQRLREWRGQNDFEDDISVLVLESPLEPSEKSNTEVRLLLNSNPAEVPELHAKLSALCADAGLDDLAAFELTCAIVEAVNNCIEHAYGGEPGHPITLLWVRKRDEIAVEIRDRGRPMPSPPPESPAMAETDAESGRGWHIIREWTDTATYAREANENVLTLTRRL
jgi:sigma-B regulation protein RsbU (phosphoserine phosphatase)